VPFGVALKAFDSSSQPAAFVTGMTTSLDFPTTPGAFQTAPQGAADAFLSKLNGQGNGLIYSTYLGGSRDDGADQFGGVSVDWQGKAYVTSDTNSIDFPLMNAAQSVYGGDPADAFVTKFSIDGRALEYSTYLGGDGWDFGSGIDVDPLRQAHVTGYTDSTTGTFPVTPGAFQTARQGSSDAFVTKFAVSGALAYSTYLGGSASENAVGGGIAVDRSGYAYVTGLTDSDNFPTTARVFQKQRPGGLSDGFVTKFNRSGSALIYSTFLGGTGDDYGVGIAVDEDGSAHVASGVQTSQDFPVKAAFQPHSGGGQDAAITKLDPTGRRLVYSSYLGGSMDDQPYGRGVALGPDGSAFVIGFTTSRDFPTTRRAFQRAYQGDPEDAFVTKIGPPARDQEDERGRDDDHRGGRGHDDDDD
jgi:hypothetical protein